MEALTLHPLCEPLKLQCAPWLNMKPQKSHKFFRLFISLHKLHGSTHIAPSVCTVENSVRSVVNYETTKGTKVFSDCLKACKSCMEALTLHPLCAPEKPQCAPCLNMKPKRGHKFSESQMIKSAKKLYGRLAPSNAGNATVFILNLLQKTAGGGTLSKGYLTKNPQTSSL